MICLGSQKLASVHTKIGHEVSVAAKLAEPWLLIGQMTLWKSTCHRHGIGKLYRVFTKEKFQLYLMEHGIGCASSK